MKQTTLFTRPAVTYNSLEELKATIAANEAMLGYPEPKFDASSKELLAGITFPLVVPQQSFETHWSGRTATAKTIAYREKTAMGSISDLFRMGISLERDSALDKALIEGYVYILVPADDGQFWCAEVFRRRNDQLSFDACTINPSDRFDVYGGVLRCKQN